MTDETNAANSGAAQPCSFEKLRVDEIEPVERMLRVLDAAVHVHAALGAGVRARASGAWSPTERPKRSDRCPTRRQQWSGFSQLRGAVFWICPHLAQPTATRGCADTEVDLCRVLIRTKESDQWPGPLRPSSRSASGWRSTATCRPSFDLTRPLQC